MLFRDDHNKVDNFVHNSKAVEIWDQHCLSNFNASADQNVPIWHRVSKTVKYGKLTLNASQCNHNSASL